MARKTPFEKNRSRWFISGGWSSKIDLVSSLVVAHGRSVQVHRFVMALIEDSNFQTNKQPVRCKVTIVNHGTLGIGENYATHTSLYRRARTHGLLPLTLEEALDWYIGSSDVLLEGETVYVATSPLSITGRKHEKFLLRVVRRCRRRYICPVRIDSASMSHPNLRWAFVQMAESPSAS